MIIVDTALKRREEERNPIHVAMTGAGNIGRALTLVIEKYITGMKLVAIANRTLANAEKAYRQAEVDSINKVKTIAQLENSIATGQYAITTASAMLGDLVPGGLLSTNNLSLAPRLAVA